MAERRMVSCGFLTSDAFLHLPLQARSLYIALLTAADDDGFVDNPEAVRKSWGLRKPALSQLLEAGLLLDFDGVVLLTHWLQHNRIPRDRYRPTRHTALLVMGRTQGKGCYCFVNGILQAQLEKYTGQYRYTVIDNEAGMEYIARGTLPHVDTLLLVSDCSRRGIQAVGRIAQLAQDLHLTPGRVRLIVNRAPEGKLNPGVLEEIEANGLELAGVVPQDEAVYDADCAGQPSAHIAADAKSKQALREIFKSLNI